MSKGDLFKGQPREISRDGDPATSKEAARDLYEAGVLGEMMAATFALLLEHPGSTASELENLMGVSDGRYRKRLNDLRKQQYAHMSGTRKCRVSGRKAHIWWPVG